jgi:D-tyrosyl-tRNA(Tyr) deacylase
MRAVIQRVKEARVEVDGEVTGRIGQGLLIFLGIHKEDSEVDAEYLIGKFLELRIFSDTEDRMNLSVRDVEGGVLLVSQFTLYGDTRKGRRPSFDQAAKPDRARELYDYAVAQTRARHPVVATGVFQASMQVHSVNDGPVTFICESVRQTTH